MDKKTNTHFRLPSSESKKELVIKLLKKDTDGLTILEIARELKISRNSVPVILAELKGAQLIRIRPVGKAKLHYWKGKK
jgi:Mn-dependent DtxR family transcriptional regulator